MTRVVGSGVAPHTAAHARRAKKRKAAAHVAPPKPAPKPAVATAATPVAGAVAGAAAITAPAPAPAPTPEPEEPKGPVKSPEYAPVDLADVLGGVAGGVTKDLFGPVGKPSVIEGFDIENNPVFASKMGAVIPAKFAGLMVGEVGNIVGGALTSALQGALHGKVPGVGEKKPGLGISITPADELATKLTRSVLTTWAGMALRGELKPPPPPPPVGKDAPKDAPKGVVGDTKSPPPGDQPPAKPIPNPQRDAMKQPLGPLAQAAVNNITNTAIGAVYDQALAPLVQRAVNVLMLNPSAEIKKPAPLTPGKLARGFVGDMLTPLLVPSVKLADGTPATFGGTLGSSIANNILGAAFDTFYSRGLGPAVENAVNGVAGVRDPEAVKKDPLPAAERFLRSATRGVAVGATTFALGSALNSTIVHLGASMGGVGGALVAMAGAALIGSIGGQVVDAVAGPMLGKLGGQLYSMLSGKPSYEQRMKDAAAKAPAPAPGAPTPAKPGPTPGSPVDAANGNPGTVPAPPAAPKAAAMAAPAAGKPGKRKKLGQPRVDATAPALTMSLAKLQAAALQGG